MIPLGYTLLLTFISIFSIMVIGGNTVSSALSIAFGGTAVGSFPPALLWLLVVSLIKRENKMRDKQVLSLRIAIAFISSVIWTLVASLFLIPSSEGGWGDLAIIIIALFAGIFFISNLIVELVLYLLQIRKTLEKRKTL
jgi:hypothetical protein